MLISFVEPVVRRNEIACTLVVNNTSESSVGVELAVLADKILAGRHSVYIVAKTVGVVGGKVIVCPDISACGIISQTTDIFIFARLRISDHFGSRGGIRIQRIVVSFVVLGRIFDIVVVLGGAHIYTPLGIDRNLGFAEFGALGGDQDDTVGTAGTVKSIRCSVLEDGHRLDIIGIKSIDIV